MSSKDLVKLFEPTKPGIDARKIQLLTEIIRAKFTENQVLCEKLRKTGKAPLYEATLDNEFGCGLRLHQHTLIGPRKIKLFGKILLQISEELPGDNSNQ